MRSAYTERQSDTVNSLSEWDSPATIGIVLKYGGFPHFVLDQRALRNRELLDDTVQRARAHGGYLLVPDVALLELGKSTTWEKPTRAALANLARHPAEVYCVTKSIGELLREEREQKRPAYVLTSHDATMGFRALVEEVRAHTDEPSWRELRETLSPGALTAMQRAAAHFGRGFADYWSVWNSVPRADTRKRLLTRPADTFPEVLFGTEFETIRIGVLKNIGFDDPASDVRKTASVTGLVELCTAAWTLDWIAQGGYESAGRETLSHDGNDIVYVTYALLGNGFASYDTKACRMYGVLKSLLHGT